MPHCSMHPPNTLSFKSGPSVGHDEVPKGASDDLTFGVVGVIDDDAVVDSTRNLRSNLIVVEGFPSLQLTIRSGLK